MISDEVTGAIETIVNAAEGGGIVVQIEDAYGDLFEVESVRLSHVGGGIIIIKAKPYDDEYDPAEEDGPDPDVEL